MQFTILAYDGTDEGALERRLAARAAHLALGDEMAASGRGICAAALLDDDDRMIGSVMVVDFPSRDDLDAYLAEEPYVTGKVWQEIQILPCRVGPSYARKS